MAKVRDLYKKRLPFCPLCFRYMTRSEALNHQRDARVIRWPKK